MRASSVDKCVDQCALADPRLPQKAHNQFIVVSELCLLEPFKMRIKIAEPVRSWVNSFDPLEERPNVIDIPLFDRLSLPVDNILIHWVTIVQILPRSRELKRLQAIQKLRRQLYALTGS